MVVKVPVTNYFAGHELKYELTPNKEERLGEGEVKMSSKINQAQSVKDSISTLEDKADEGADLTIFNVQYAYIEHSNQSHFAFVIDKDDNSGERTISVYKDKDLVFENLQLHVESRGSPLQGCLMHRDGKVYYAVVSEEDSNLVYSLYDLAPLYESEHPQSPSLLQ